MSIYALKGRFQDLLRPCVRVLHEAGITANQVTLAAAALSLLVAALVFAFAPGHTLLYLLLPGWMLLRMALNAIDGMLAREFGQKSPLGAYLNELCDAVSDAALYLSLLGVPGVQPQLLWAMVAMALLTEYAGVLGLMVGASRRYEGPMGKSDRALVIGVVGVLLAMGWIDGTGVDIAAMIVAALCLPTLWRRVGAGLQEVRKASGEQGE
ncbi:MAG: CDP-alcohol phosphatidyltransferase family protein [Luteimonas sp.]